MRRKAGYGCDRSEQASKRRQQGKEPQTREEAHQRRHLRRNQHPCHRRVPLPRFPGSVPVRQNAPVRGIDRDRGKRQPEVQRRGHRIRRRQSEIYLSRTHPDVQRQSRDPAFRDGFLRESHERGNHVRRGKEPAGDLPLDLHQGQSARALHHPRQNELHLARRRPERPDRPAAGARRRPSRHRPSPALREHAVLP